MAAQTQSQVVEQREVIAQKVEKEIQRKANLGTKLIHFNRAILQGLPDAGQTQLLADEHRDLIDRLLEKHGRDNYRVLIKRIIGYASEFDDESENHELAQQRANEVHQYLLNAMGVAGLDPSVLFANYFTPANNVLGYSELLSSELALSEEPSHPRYKRVEILYNFFIELPQPAGSNIQKSTMWKIDFGPAGSGFFFSGGVGTLTMLPDGLEGPASAINKSFKFEQLGVSMGLFGKLMKSKKIRKFLKKFPLIRRLLHDLHPQKAGNYAKTSNLLQSVGFSADAVSDGGEFATVEPLSFADMRSFKYYTLSASLSIVGKGEVALIMLHDTSINIFSSGPLIETSPLFAFTMIYGAGVNIAVPDLEAQAVPLGFVQLNDV